MLDLIENKQRGILAILDEECAFPKATDKTFVTRLGQILAKNKFYEASRFKADVRAPLAFCVIQLRSYELRSSQDEFLMKHYAAKVTYQGRGFLDKNKSFLVAEHSQLLLGCKCASSPLLIIITLSPLFFTEASFATSSFVLQSSPLSQTPPPLTTTLPLPFLPFRPCRLSPLVVPVLLPALRLRACRRLCLARQPVRRRKPTLPLWSNLRLEDPVCC